MNQLNRTIEPNINRPASMLARYHDYTRRIATEVLRTGRGGGV